MSGVLCLGEALIDFVADVPDVTLVECPGFRKAAGGGVANVSVALARQGVGAAFLGRVGADPFGEFLRLALAGAGVDTSCMVFDQEARTGLAFVSLTDDGERDFVFFRNPSADMRYCRADLPLERIAACEGLHFSSITLIQDPSREATLAAVELARESGALISFDPNLRPPLWTNLDAAQSEIRAALPLAHLVKMSEEEAALVVGEAPLHEQARLLHGMGPRLVAITRGPAGLFLSASGGEQLHCDPLPVDAVDATGAGDACAATLLAGIVARFPDMDLAAEELFTLARRAAAAGALTCLRRGAIPALPTWSEIDRALQATPG